MTDRDYDRRVHATMPDGSVLVRYDHAGKWYQEWEAARLLLTFTEVVERGAEATVVHYGLRGGRTFDKRVREKRRSDD